MAGRVPPQAAVAAQSLLLDVATLEITGELEASGIPYVLLKGPAIATWLYEIKQARPYVDVDLLVPSQMMTLAEELICDLGWEAVHTRPLRDLPNDRPTYVSALKRRVDGVVVELHQTILGVGVGPEDLWNELSKHQSYISLRGSSVSALDHSGLSFHAALHAAQDGARALKPIEDLRRAVIQASPDEWFEAAEIARLTDSLPAFVSGLAMVEGGEELRARLALDVARSTVSEIEAGRASRASKEAAIALAWFTGLPGWSARCRWAFYKILPPPDFMRAWSSLARTSPAGLFLSYLWRPFWLLKQLVLGLWLRIRMALRP
jgi:hypothetical protein